MKKYIKAVIALLMIMTLMTGCGSKEDETTGNTATVISKDSEMFTERDYDATYDESESVLINLEGDTATASSDSVKVLGSTITITEEATYIVSGTLNDGMIIVDAGKSAKLQIVLKDAKITSKTSAALYVLEAKKVFVTLAEGSENTLANGGTFTQIDDNNIDGVVYSKGDTTFNGGGSLVVTSPVANGIVCKDDLKFTGGEYSVASASHGIEANDSVRITGETDITIDAGKDGIHSENADDEELGFVYISDVSLDIEAEGDGISAANYVQINDGNFDITVGGGSENGTKESSDSWGGFNGGPGGGGPAQQSPDRRTSESESSDSTTSTEDSTSMKGIKAGGNIVVSDGEFKIDSADDSIHSNGSITINDGDFKLASGDDGVHADDTLVIANCNMNITESYEGLEAHHIKVKGGKIKLVATDDGLNAAGGADSSGEGGRDGKFGGGGGSSSSDGTIVISGGNLYINASGDGIDANGTLEITGGYTVVVGPTQGDTATLDYDVSGTITGGTFIGTGASNMAQSFSDSSQGVIALNVGNQTAGTNVKLTDADGNVLFDYEPELSFQVLILSSEKMTSGEEYTISIGDYTGSFTAS